MKIPASYPSFTQEDKELLHTVVDDGWLTEGKFCAKFRRDLCKVTGKKHALLVNSGSSANLVAMRVALDFFPGKYVITTATGFPTTVAPIYQHNKIPIYIDTDPKTLSPDMGQLAYMIDKWGDQVAGVIFAHTLGFPFDERLVRQIIGDRFLIADCCDCLGGYVWDKPVGYWADIATHSFFPAHMITMGEGGALVTDDDKMISLAHQYSNWGRLCTCAPGQSNTCGKRFERNIEGLPEGWDCKYTFTRLGYNLKITEFQGALGYSQIQRLPEFVSKRNRNYCHLYDELSDLEPYFDFVQMSAGQVPFGFPLILKDNIKTLFNSFVQHLESNGIATRRVFGGNLLRQPAFRHLQYISVPDLDGSNKLMEQCVWVGIHPQVTSEMVEYMGKTVHEFFNERMLI